MFESYPKELLQSGIAEAKGGNRDTARRYLERALNAAVTGEHDLIAEIWYWLSQVVNEPSEKRKALENALSYDLHHSRARRELAILDGKITTDELVDPDQLPASTPTTQPADAQRFACPNCGARMVYAPDGHTLICENCLGGKKMTSQPGAQERDFIIAMATRRGHSRPLEEQIVQCQGCGARYILPGKQLSFNCLYCSSPHVIELDRSIDVLAPDAILPHAFNRDRAARLLVDWVQGSHIQPDRQVDRPRGMYLPLWTFDIGGAIQYAGEIVEIEMQGLERGQTKIRRVTDEYPALMNNLAIPASRKPSAVFIKLIPSFDLTALLPYDPRYLADWPAEVYDISMANASLEARSQAYSRLKAELPALVDSIKILHTSSANLTIESFKLVLLPVWLTGVPYAGRAHQVLINGQSGVIQVADA